MDVGQHDHPSGGRSRVAQLADRCAARSDRLPQVGWLAPHWGVGARPQPDTAVRATCPRRGTVTELAFLARTRRRVGHASGRRWVSRAVRLEVEHLAGRGQRALTVRSEERPYQGADEAPALRDERSVAMTTPECGRL